MTSTDRPSFDLTEIPFSRRGSWLDISPVVGLHRYADDLHLVSHVTDMTAVLRLVPTLGARRVTTTWSGRPGVLRWESESGTVEAAFDDTATIRLRGTGIGMTFAAADGRLTPFTGPYLMSDPVDGSAVFTLYETGRRYRITGLAGTVSLTGEGVVGETERAVAVEPGADGTWEAAVEELTAARRAHQSTSTFDEIVGAAEQEFDAFLNAVAPWRSSAVPATALAVYVVWSATVAPAGFLQRDGVLMSKHWMDSLWSWDHCFNALATVGLPAFAWDQLQMPFDHQDPTGALPDSVTHSRVLYNYVKPPIHGWMYRELLAAGLPEPAPHELATWYDRLAAWTRFWLDHRRAPGHALPYYQHGNDSGWDNATSFDLSRVIEAPDLAAFLVLQLETLADLAGALGRGDDAAHWRGTADHLAEELVAQLWNGSQFVVRDAHTGAVHASRSLLGLVPVVLGERLAAEVVERLAELAEQHLTEFGLATEPVDSPLYDDDGYWRGPIWAPSTFIVENGFRRAGCTELADRIEARFRMLCETNGFAENFDARTGTGLRDRAYTWTASVYLRFAAAHVGRGDRMSELRFGDTRAEVTTGSPRAIV